MEHDTLKWCLLLALVTTNFAVPCQDNASCTCEPGVTGGSEIYCPTDGGSAFIVNTLSTKHVQVQCLNSPKWSDFHVQTIVPAKDFETVIFRSCSLPDTTLHDITRRLGVNGTKALVFQSFGNLSSTLTRHHLSGFPELNKLTLTSNGLTDLPVDLLADLPELAWLDLRGNNIRLPLQIFQNVPRLKTLELGNNVIERFHPDTFSSLTNLTFLNIWGNRLRELDTLTFDKLISLESLDISSNKLTTLPEDVFEPLVNLEVLNLHHNNFSTLPENLLAHNTNLTRISLFENARNMTTLPRGFLSNLHKLKEVTLVANGLEYLPEDMLWGASVLKNLSLERNYLASLPKKIFKDQKELISLNLSVNEFTTLADETFASMPKLLTLDLSKNHLATISESLFSDLTALVELNIENNQLLSIHGQAFASLENLRVARFAHNQLTFKDESSTLQYENEFGDKSIFHHCTNLNRLYLAHNNITEIFGDWSISGPQLTYVDLSYNKISEIKTDDLQFTSGNIIVDLTNNNISRIELKSANDIAAAQTFPDTREVHILVDENPLHCDCDVYELLRYLDGSMHPNVQKLFHIKPGSLKCNSPSWMKDILVTDLKSNSMKCLVEENDQCPKNCMCWRRPHDMAFLIDCSYRNLSKAPEKLPALDGFHIELDLTGNFLTEVPFVNQSGYRRISTMLLSHNNISSLSSDTLSPRLKVLALHNNKLSNLNRTVLDFMRNHTSLTNLTLHANPWKCDCEARELLNFIQTKYTEIPELINITCFENNESLSNMTVNDLCPVATGMVIGISLTIAILGLVTGSLAALYYRYQQQVKVWLYAHQMCLWFVTEEELDKDKQYDAFISYSHKDEEFVLNELVSKLEDGPMPFKLCLHFRNWMAGDWIPTQIARSVDDSKRTIVVLSPNFLESVWGRLEFRAAHRQALSEGRARVIVILLGDIGPTDALDTELKAYLSMNTYVKWGDPWFWDKLRYAMPHPPELTKRAAKKIFESHQPRIQLHGDKNELVVSPGVPVAPSAITTPPVESCKIFIPNGNVKNGSVLTDTLQNGKPEMNDSMVKQSSTPTKDNYKNNMINVQCTPV